MIDVIYRKLRTGYRLLKEGKTKKIFYIIWQKILKRIYSKPPDDPVYVLQEEWDYLILLDACRFDYFKKYSRLPGELKKKKSPSTNTITWLKTNFKKYNEDIVYISSNPHISKHELGGFKGTNYFYKVESLWDYGWDDELGTVTPEKVTEAALKAKEKYPEKKIDYPLHTTT